MNGTRRTDARDCLLLVIDSLAPSGGARQLALLATGLRSEYDVHVCALRNGGPIADDLRNQDQSVPVTVLGQSLPLDPRTLWRLKRRIAKLRPAIVHAWGGAAAAYATAAVLGRRKRRLIVSRRCADGAPGGLSKFLGRAIVRRAQRVVVDSAAVRQEYERRVPASKLATIPSGVSLEQPPPLPRGAILGPLGLPSDARLLCYAGSLTPRKRLKELIWAIEQLNVVHQRKVHLLLIGDGPQRELIERYISLFQIEGNVHFLGLRNDVRRILPHCEALWLASTREGLSVAILEAMAAGVPVVATDVAGNRELVVPGVTGFLVSPTVRSAFARQTHRLLIDADLAAKMRAAAQQRAAQFSAEKMVARYAALYREVLAPAASQRNK